MSPRVSVLIPAYNSGPFLAEAVESVIAQTFADWELIVIDDASTDDVVRHVRPDARVSLLRNPTNLGQSRSLNRGMIAARGEYVACLDHDDVAEPQRLARQVAFLDARPDVGLLGSWATPLDGAPLNVARPPSSPAVLAWALAGGCPLAHSGMTFRRAAALALGGYDPEAAPADDYDLWTRLVRAGTMPAALPVPLCRLRRHPGQQSQTKAQQQARQAVAVAGRQLTWLLGETLAADGVGALLSLFDPSGAGCRHPLFARAVALLPRLTRRCAERFGDEKALRQAATKLLLRSAGAALAGAAKGTGAGRLSARAIRASFAAARLAW